MKMKSLCVMACLFAASIAHSTYGQSFVIDLPMRSQRATISQRIGLTDITIRYHRPLVNGRKIWGDLVPYGKVWRTGANAITTITVTDPVTIAGSKLEAGTYGLHAIPNPDRWTIIFSKNSTSWGSFTYDQAEDALRVDVKPQAAEMHNALTFEFDDPQPDSTVVALKWERLAVPFRIVVDTHQVVQDSLKKQLRTLSRYTWMSWHDAARWLLSEKISLDDALTYTNRSIQNEDRFENELTKSKVLRALNRDGEASAAERRALDLGSSEQVHDLAVDRLQTNREEAFAMFRENARKHPGDWIAHEGLARMYAAQQQMDKAAIELKVALASAPETERSSLEELSRKLLGNKLQ